MEVDRGVEADEQDPRARRERAQLVMRVGRPAGGQHARRRELLLCRADPGQE